MKRSDFNDLRERTVQSIFGLNDSKGADYAGDEDALGNFKDAARAIGITPEQVWAVYTHKHISAVMSYCEKGQVESEPIEGRIHDVMVYCLLLLGLIEDRARQDAERDRVPAAAPSADEAGVRNPGRRPIKRDRL